MPQFDAMKVWSVIVDERVSIGGAVPAILNFMRQVPQFAELNAPDFRYFITGGAPMPEALIKMYAAKNIEVVQGYALTESCGGGTLLLSEDALRKAGSAGRATMFTDVRVRRRWRNQRTGGRRSRDQVRHPAQGILESSGCHTRRFR
jgi:acyl-CoA synthetase (AMP-forming)/AMP-acid ligase II